MYVANFIPCLYIATIQRTYSCMPMISIGRASLIVHIKFLLIKSANYAYITLKSPQLHYCTDCH